MCNPPFFECIEELDLNTRALCRGTHKEMVCTGRERSFITQIIEDSILLKHSFRFGQALLFGLTNKCTFYLRGRLRLPYLCKLHRILLLFKKERRKEIVADFRSCFF